MKLYISLPFLYRSFHLQGRVVDTPEVARAKAAHLAAYNHIASSAPVGEDHPQSYDHHYYGAS